MCRAVAARTRSTRKMFGECFGADGKPRFKYIVEGANLFFTQVGGEERERERERKREGSDRTKRAGKDGEGRQQGKNR